MKKLEEELRDVSVSLFGGKREELKEGSWRVALRTWRVRRMSGTSSEMITLEPRFSSLRIIDWPGSLLLMNSLCCSLLT